MSTHQQRGMGAEDYCTCDRTWPCHCASASWTHEHYPDDPRCVRWTLDQPVSHDIHCPICRAVS